MTPEAENEIREQRGRNVFRTVCEAGDVSVCLDALEPWARMDLYCWLSQNYRENGISGQVLGMMLVDAGRRLYSARPPEGGTFNEEELS